MESLRLGQTSRKPEAWKSDMDCPAAHLPKSASYQIFVGPLLAFIPLTYIRLTHPDSVHNSLGQTILLPFCRPAVPLGKRGAYPGVKVDQDTGLITVPAVYDEVHHSVMKLSE